MKIFTDDEIVNPPKLEINFVEISRDGEVAICFARRNNINYVYYCLNFIEEAKKWYKQRDNTVVNYDGSDYKFRDTSGCTIQTITEKTNSTIFNTTFNVYFISTQQCKTENINGNGYDTKIKGDLNNIYYYQFEKEYSVDENGLTKIIKSQNFNGLKSIYSDIYSRYVFDDTSNNIAYEYYEINCSSDNKALFLGISSGVMYVDLTKPYDTNKYEIYTAYLAISNNGQNGGDDIDVINPKKVACLSSNLSGIFQHDNKLFYGYYQEYQQNSKTYYFQYYKIQSDFKFYNVSQIFYDSILKKHYFYANVLEKDKKYDSLFIFEYPPVNNGGNYTIKSTKIYSDYGWNDYSQVIAIQNSDGSHVLGMCGSFGLIYNYNKSTTNLYNCSKFGYKMDRCSITNIDNNNFTMISCKDNNNLYFINTPVPPENIPTTEFSKKVASDKNNEISNFRLCETAHDGNFCISYGRNDKKNYIYTYNGTVDNWVRSNANYDNNYSYIASTSYTYADSSNGETLRAYFITENSSATYISYYSMYGSILKNNDTLITRYEIKIRDKNGSVIGGVEGYKSLNINSTGTAMSIGTKFRLILVLGDKSTRQLTQSNQSYITSYCSAKNEGLYISSVSCSSKSTVQGLFVNAYNGKTELYSYYKIDSDPTIYYGTNGTEGKNGNPLTSNCYKISNIITSSSGAELFYLIQKDSEGLFYIKLCRVYFNKNKTTIEPLSKKYDYNWNFANLRMYNEYNFCASGRIINNVNTGLVSLINGIMTEYIKPCKDYTWCSISYNLNSDFYIDACANDNIIYNYNTASVSTTSASITTTNMTNIEKDMTNIVNPYKLKILKKASFIFKKIKCLKKYKVLQQNLQKNKDICNFKKFVKPIVKFTDKIQKYFNYDINFSLKITFYDLNGCEITFLKMIRFKNNTGYILFNPIFNKLFDNYDKKSPVSSLQNKIMFNCDFFYD
jgi:hypothetical protein